MANIWTKTVIPIIAAVGITAGGIAAYSNYAAKKEAPKPAPIVREVPTEYTLLADPFGRDGERISFEYTKPAKDVMPKSTAYLKTITDSNKEVTIKFDDILRGEGSRTLYRMKAGDRFILQDENNKKGDLEDIKIIAAAPEQVPYRKLLGASELYTDLDLDIYERFDKGADVVLRAEFVRQFEGGLQEPLEKYTIVVKKSDGKKIEKLKKNIAMGYATFKIDDPERNMNNPYRPDTANTGFIDILQTEEGPVYVVPEDYISLVDARAYEIGSDIPKGRAKGKISLDKIEEPKVRELLDKKRAEEKRAKLAAERAKSVVHVHSYNGKKLEKRVENVEGAVSGMGSTLNEYGSRINAVEGDVGSLKSLSKGAKLEKTTEYWSLVGKVKRGEIDQAEMKGTKERINALHEELYDEPYGFWGSLKK